MRYGTGFDRGAGYPKIGKRWSTRWVHNRTDDRTAQRGTDRGDSASPDRLAAVSSRATTAAQFFAVDHVKMPVGQDGRGEP